MLERKIWRMSIRSQGGVMHMNGEVKVKKRKKMGLESYGSVMFFVLMKEDESMVKDNGEIRVEGREQQRKWRHPCDIGFVVIVMIGECE
ncbi:hypothetical protein DEO72_LG1g1934 [Vigna unguiculata]|uniref:Uncharacterized protein n=1 Tax=Vigna unguiculata TaxID=3917 RepID=A0A4D6KLE9_VIGUN|nr:hypothetical protein DEO72_LG1g1934 [Vigna unguiculata]